MQEKVRSAPHGKSRAAGGNTTRPLQVIYTSFSCNQRLAAPVVAWPFSSGKLLISLAVSLLFPGASRQMFGEESFHAWGLEHPCFAGLRSVLSPGSKREAPWSGPVAPGIRARTCASLY